MTQKSVYREEFKIHLERLGYTLSSQSMLPSCVAEFLDCLGKKGVTSLTHIQPKHIMDHYHYLSERPNQRRPGGLSSRMIAHHLYAIRLFLNFKLQTGGLTSNPMSGLSFPRPESPQREILTTGEIEKLYQAAETLRDKAILGLFYGCGLRRNEGVSLEVKDISFAGSVLYVREGKGNHRRVVPISEKVRDDFKNYLEKERITKENEAAFITNAKGAKTHGNDLNKTLKAIVKTVGIEKEISLHNLRHSIASHLLDNGLPVEAVRDFLGHKHLEATQVYTRVSKWKLSAL